MHPHMRHTRVHIQRHVYLEARFVAVPVNTPKSQRVLREAFTWAEAAAPSRPVLDCVAVGLHIHQTDERRWLPLKVDQSWGTLC